MKWWFTEFDRHEFLSEMSTRRIRTMMVYPWISIVAILLVLIGWLILPGNTGASGSAMTGLHVRGNKIVNGSGQTVRLFGANRSGTEYVCIQGRGIFDGPSDAASVQAMASWGLNTVRIPLNEDCWLGINSNSAYIGAPYRSAITSYVHTIEAAGMAVILELHWSAPGTSAATQQQPMPDRDHAPAFWTSVAQAFGGDKSVLFDLYNEPYPVNNTNGPDAWTCLKKGGTCVGVPFRAAGMQELTNAVRATGAANILMVPGLMYADVLIRWLNYKPADPLHNIAASWHAYQGQICDNPTCRANEIAPVGRSVPLIAAEIGERDCGHGFLDTLLPFLDSLHASYIGWAWNAYGCDFPSLITNYDGTPSAMGQGLKDHLSAVLNNPQPAPRSLSVILHVQTSAILRVHHVASVRISVENAGNHHPISGAAVSLDGRTVGVRSVHRSTNKHGAVTFKSIKPQRSGLIRITASGRGYVRNSVTLRVLP